MINHTPKPIACHGGCGKQVLYKTSPKVYCDDCRKTAIRNRSRETMANVRIAKGVVPVKGLPYKCSVCGCEYIRNMVRSHRCPTCQDAAATKVSRNRAAAVRASEEGRKYIRQWTNNRRAVDPSWSVSAHMTTLIHRALGKGKAGKSWRTFVDYSLEELMVHLEKQFLPGMTWVNRCDWHIDHIIPRSLFKYESAQDPEFKSAWVLSNLRPIWAIDNIRKNAKRTHLI